MHKGYNAQGHEMASTSPFMLGEAPYQASFEAVLIPGSIYLSTHNPTFNQQDIFYCKVKIGGFASEI